MTTEVTAALAETRTPCPDDPVSLTRVIIDSLALRYASVLADIERLTGQRLGGVHIVGGGSLNDALNQATADASGRLVLAGPVEATVVGNLFVQAVATGELSSITAGRRMLAETTPLRRFEPRDSERWRVARARYRELEVEAGL
jgi:rhamnulokinase